MKLCCIAGPFCLANGDNGFNFAQLWTDPRGLSGSDLGVFRIAQELARLGHELEVFTFPKPGTPIIAGALGPGVTVRHYDERVDFDGQVAVSWNEAEPLRCYQHRTDLKRVVSLQINSLVGGPGFEWVDMWLSPSEAHRRMILSKVHSVGPWRQEVPYTPKPEQWHVVPDGCDPSVYDQLWKHGCEKIPGRVVWTSSPDRGLHWTLSIWARIKRAVPHATLAITYRLRPWLDHMLRQESAEFDPSILEQVRRAHYIDDALARFGNMGVAELGSLSRRDVARVQAEAECFCYPCDPAIDFTEGFSCSLAEACAAKAGPIATDVDALGEIYKGYIPTLPRPTSATIDQYAETTIRMLTDERFRSETNERARALAEMLTWKKAAERLAEVIC